MMKFGKMRKNPLTLLTPALLLVLTGCLSLTTSPAQAEVTLKDDGKGKVEVEIDGQLFTAYHYGKTHDKYFNPILYPVIGPTGDNITRNYPMKKVKGEATDHPHHQGVWFNHGDVNGISFWHIGDKTGKIVHQKFVHQKTGKRYAQIKAENNWVGPEGNIVLTDVRTITFSKGMNDARIIDLNILLKMTHGSVKFGDTKEGSMGIRTHPNLRLKNDPGRGVTTANGQAVNSEGVTGKNLWGKRATWVDYYGKIDNKTVGVAIFEHPQNPRTPTWWHARDYGLVAANPFGVSYFEGKKRGTGDMLFKPGDRVRFRYRFIFHEGDAKAANIGTQFKLYRDASQAAD